MGHKMADRLFFSTDSLTERDRFPAFCEEYVRRYTGLDFVKRDRSEFRAAVELKRAGAVDIGCVSVTPVDSVRSPSLVRDGDDALLIMLIESGAAHQTQRKHDQMLDAGDAIICDCGYPGAVNIITNSKFWNLKVPRYKITKLLPGVTSFAGAKLDKDPVARRLLFGYLGVIHGVDLSGRRDAAQLCDEHIIDLIVLALGAEGDARELVEQRSVGAMRRADIFREIEARATDPRLSADAIATDLRITPRYLRMLLEETGRSFSGHVLEKRLNRAADLLRDPRREDSKVSAIAFECGFGDLSYFNRAFRRRYGETPSDARQRARGQDRDDCHGR
jgi:AraC-like DNA-binding protein